MSDGLSAALVAFQRTYGRPLERAFRAPGRVNLIGEHTDYSGGLVLPMAVDREVLVLAALARDSSVRVYSSALGELEEFPLPQTLGQAARLPLVQGVGQRRGHWSDYVIGVLRELHTRGVALVGCDLLVHSTVPIGSGLSSSAAFTVALALALTRMAGANLAPADLALLCQAAEQRAAGVECGIMDQFTVALARKGHAFYLDCSDVSYRYIPLDESRARIVLADSGKGRALAASGYNQRRRELEEAVAWLRRAHNLASPRALTLDLLNALPPTAHPEPVEGARRLRHVVEENARVEASLVALEHGRLDRFGKLMLASHASLRDWYEVSTPELDALVESAAATSGCLGAKLSGAGFGGATVNLVAKDQVERFRGVVAESYTARTGLQATLYPCRSADGASEVRLS